MRDVTLRRCAVVGSFALACPSCGGSLDVENTEASCVHCNQTFPRVAGIWRFLPESRRQRFADFLEEYRTVRLAEGWGCPDPAYYRSLPWVSRNDPQRQIWKLRARSYRHVLKRVLRPREAGQNRPLRLLDLGAGNGWLAHRLATRGHDVMAIDLSTDDVDGLGALVQSVGEAELGPPVQPVQAEFDRLPLAAGQADLVIFNGSFHYATSFETTLKEALRVLRADGQIVILDSPFYTDGASGAAMMRERQARFTHAHGFSGTALPTEGYLTPARLDRLGLAANVQWFSEQPGGRWRETLGRWRARLRGRREPASFPVLIGRRGGATAPRAVHSRVVRAAWRRLLRLRLRLFQKHRLDRPVLETVDGTSILVLPGVFNPKLLRTGAFLVQFLETRDVRPESVVLDLGTGTGIGAVFAGKRARRVVAVDLNPEAARCARINLALHHLDDHCEVREGDLFGPVGDERFDLILFNPPFYRGEPRDAADRAWRATDVVERFAVQVADHLTPDGEALVVLSSDGDAAAFLDALQANRLAVVLIASRDLVNETLAIYRVQKAER